MKREEIMAYIARSKNFEVGDWFYENMTTETVIAIFDLYHKEWDISIDQTKSNTPNTTIDIHGLGLFNTNIINFIKDGNVIKFFRNAKGKFSYNHKLIKYLSDNYYVELGFLLFSGKYEWLELLDEFDRHEAEIIITNLFSISAMYSFNDSIRDLLFVCQRYSNIGIESIIKRHTLLLKHILKIDDTIITNSLVTIAYACELDRHPSFTPWIWKNNLPVLPILSDITYLMVYLDAIIDNNYKGELSASIYSTINGEWGTVDQDICSIKDIYDKIIYITKNINQNIIGLLRYIKVKTKYTLDDVFDWLTINATEPVIPLQNYNDIIDIIGDGNDTIELQKLFLKNGGDVSTMRMDCELFRSTQSIVFTFLTLDSDGIRYLINNSVDFVTNLVKNNWVSVSTGVKVLKALFEYPINEELWNVLNHKGEPVIDYREIIIRRMIQLIPHNSLYQLVPESLAYMTPGLLHISRIISDNNIQYIPANNLSMFIENIMSKFDYIKLNYFCNGEEVSITSVIDKEQFIKIIMNNHQYAYIDDVKGTSQIEIIDLIADK